MCKVRINEKDQERERKISSKGEEKEQVRETKISSKKQAND